MTQQQNKTMATYQTQHICTVCTVHTVYVYHIRCESLWRKFHISSVLVLHYHFHVSQVYSSAGGFQRLKSTLVLFEFASTMEHSTEDFIICYIYCIFLL
jgi:hypothetical protein